MTIRIKSRRKSSRKSSRRKSSKRRSSKRRSSRKSSRRRSSKRKSSRRSSRRRSSKLTKHFDKNVIDNSLEWYTACKNLRISKSYNFVNAPRGIKHGLSGPIYFTNYRKKGIKWDDLYCIDQGVGIFRVKTFCNSSSNEILDDNNPALYEVFVKLEKYQLKNLYDYAKLIQAGQISKKDHDKLFGFIGNLQKSLDKKSGLNHVMINHNMDVPFLHFKFSQE